MPKLVQSADAQGARELETLHDINVAYFGVWSGLIKKVQPVLVDEGYRIASEERLLLETMAIAQRQVGPAGVKQVFRTDETIQVWRDGRADSNADSLAAAALVADDYRLFLLGPMLLAKIAARVEDLGVITVEGSVCEHLLITLKPGLGQSPKDQVDVAIDYGTHLLRRMRISLDGLASTQGAVAQIDLFDYVLIHGVRWPTHFVESLVKPIPGLSVHEWHVVGLDVDRGYSSDAIRGSSFLDSAAAPAGFR